MIVDNISNAHLYYSISPAVEKSLKYLQSTDLHELPAGKKEIEKGLVIGISEYPVREEKDARLEAHRKNIDVQYMIRGEERIGFAFASKGRENQPSTEYDETRDIQFYDKTREFFLLSEGMFAIFFPSDLHMPGLIPDGQSGNAEKVKKAVIKVSI